MKQRWWLFLGLILLIGCDSGQDSVSAAKPDVTEQIVGDKIIFPAASPKLAHLQIGVVGAAEIPKALIIAPGVIEMNPNRTARVFLPLPGQITSVKVRLGDAVQRGQPLLTVECPDAYAAVASYREAQAALRKAEAARVKAQSDLDRLTALYEHRAAAQKDVLNAKNELAQALASGEQSESASEEALHRLKILGLEPDGPEEQIVVRAPIGGKILDIRVVPREYRSDTSQPLMTIADLSSVWAASNVPESVIREVAVGEQVELRLTAYPGEVFHARVVRIADTVDPQSRTVKVQAVLDNPRGRLRPQMFGEMRHSHGSRLLPVVPPDAVVQGGEHSWVYVEEAPGTFRRVPVRPAATWQGMIPILSGVKPGDRVVTGGAVLLSRH